VRSVTSISVSSVTSPQGVGYSTYGTTKILSVQGSLTLVPGVYPLTSTYLPLESNGLNTYPGLSGTALAVGNAVEVEEEACAGGDGFGSGCVVSL